jgi:predicted nucleic acid-binding protein
MFALDTNTLICFFKGLGRVKERLAAVSPANVAIPSVVLYELEVEIARSPVTHNAGKFRRVRGLDLADWY